MSADKELAYLAYGGLAVALLGALVWSTTSDEPVGYDERRLLPESIKIHQKNMPPRSGLMLHDQVVEVFSGYEYLVTDCAFFTVVYPPYVAEMDRNEVFQEYATDWQRSKGFYRIAFKDPARSYLKDTGHPAEVRITFGPC